MHSEKVTDNFNHPHNVEDILDADGIGEVGDPGCGDIMRIYIKVVNDVIVDIKSNAFGRCAAAAASSMAPELVKGKTIGQALQLTNKAVADALDSLPPAKMNCFVLVEEGIRAAIVDYYERNGVDFSGMDDCSPGCGDCFGCCGHCGG